MEDNIPSLISCKLLRPGFEKFQEIPLTSNGVSIGRGLNNSVIVPFLAISRNHCVIRKIDENWVVEDNSTLGIKINGTTLGKGVTKVLQYEDVLSLEPCDEFVFKFTKPSDDFEIPRKRIKLEQMDSDDIFNNVKLKFEESQSYEIQHFQQKLLNAKNMQATSIMMKDQLELDMNKKIQMLKNDFASQIENLKGEKSEVEEQKALLIAERDAQLACVKQEMDAKIVELMNQIQKHNETESELLKENSNLKEKLLKEREEFLAELNRESSSKQDLLEKLEAKMQEQEEARRKEKEELELMLRKETEQLRLAKEKELQELEELKKQREKELEEELTNIKKDLEKQIQQAAQERCNAEQMLSEHMEQRRKLNDEDKAKIEQLVHEREEIQKKLSESEVNAENAIKDLKKRVEARETELAALAAQRIQQQADQSTQVITSLQEQLEKVKNELKSVETEKNTLLESIFSADNAVEGTSKEITLTEVGELMESELQCSICAELFVAATTLNCSHTFCKYCITMWKKKKKDCPICRAPITSECKSLVLDSFIDKMVQNLTEDMKKKREELLKSREELESELARQPSVGTSRRSHSYDESDYNSDSEFFEEGEEEELYEDYDDYDTYWPFHRRRYYDDSSDNSGSDEDADNSDERSGTASGDSAAGSAAPSAAAGTTQSTAVPNSTGGRSNSNGTSRRRTVDGLPGAYYGGYGRCFSCGSRGHWAPGCPYSVRIDRYGRCGRCGDCGADRCAR